MDKPQKLNPEPKESHDKDQMQKTNPEHKGTHVVSHHEHETHATTHSHEQGKDAKSYPGGSSLIAALSPKKKPFNPTTASLKGSILTENHLEGLDPLIFVSHLVVKQCVELLEALSGYETSNKYEILGTQGQRVFFAVEETNCCIVCCMRTRRCFTFKVTNYLGKPIFYIKRPCSCCWCIGAKTCCDLFGNRVNVYLVDGTRLGSVKQSYSCCGCQPKFSIRGPKNELLLRVKGPKCSLCCCCRCRLQGTIEFSLFAVNGEPQGVINKRWRGVLEEAFSDADTYAVTFDKDGDVRLKALILAASVLIDFMYFETHANTKKTK